MGHRFTVMDDGKVHAATAAGLLVFDTVEEMQEHFDNA